MGNGRLVAAHEEGYSEVYVPFCGHAMLEELSGSSLKVDDPLVKRLSAQQPNEQVAKFYSTIFDEMVEFFNLTPKKHKGIW